jgi:hypothetical protein
MDSRGTSHRLSCAYLMQRAADECRAAAHASCAEARLAHRELARRYATEARAMLLKERSPQTDQPSRPDLQKEHDDEGT